jgi:hypothetical protein
LLFDFQYETKLLLVLMLSSLLPVKGWAASIRANPKLIVEAASQAQKAVDLIGGAQG